MAAKQKKRGSDTGDKIAVGGAAAALAVGYTAPYHHDWAHNARMAGAKAQHAAKYTRPVVNRGVGVRRFGLDHFATSTHSLAFHKSAHQIHRASTDVSWGNHNFTSHAHTAHSISAPVAVGGAAALAGAAGGAYYWRKRKNGQRSRVKKGVRR